MKFGDLECVREDVSAKLVELEGNKNFPGFGLYDRVYEIPVDCYGWPSIVIVRAWTVRKDSEPRLEVHSHRLSGWDELKFGEITSDQMVAIIEIKRLVDSWRKGILEHLPPSNNRHWHRESEK